MTRGAQLRRGIGDDRIVSSLPSASHGPTSEAQIANHPSSLSPTSQKNNHTIITRHPVLIHPQHRIHMLMIPKLSQSLNQTTCDQNPQKPTSHLTPSPQWPQPNLTKTQNSQIPPTSPKPRPQFSQLSNCLPRNS
jgi:hypothetical protein